MPHEETSAGVARVLSNLAKQYAPLEELSFPAFAVANGAKSSRISLPGEDTVEKRTLERELAALAARIQFLEIKAASGTASLPITPNEPLSSAFPNDAASSSRPMSAVTPRQQRSASWVNSLLAKSNGDVHPRQLTEEQFNVLREHIDQQAQEIRSQREFIDAIKDNLAHQKRAMEELPESSSDAIATLKREIDKHSQINATYQKTLREIGQIITNVANGDLNQKVLIHATEKDEEISKFKITINTMVDQLSTFANEVTHLAKEVGTEGRLGGQAKVPGVNGIWADLTQNGEYHVVTPVIRAADRTQSTAWHKI